VPDLTISQALATLVLRWDGDITDWESERRAIIEVTNGVGELFLPRGLQGLPGVDGEPGPQLAPDLVVSEANDADVTALLPGGLGTGDRGYCVINEDTGSAFFWNGTAWLVVHEALGLEGPIGPAVGLQIGSVTTSPSGGSAAVALDASSTPTNKVFNFTLPRGTQGAIGVGEQGPPGDALASAGDVEWPVGGPLEGQTLVWDATLEKAVWAAPAVTYGPYSAGPGQFTTINDASWPENYKQLLKLTVPALPFAWHARCFGYCDVKVTGVMARVDMEARMFSATGPCVGRGAGNTVTTLIDNYTPRTLVPTFESAMTPDAPAVLVAADTIADIYLVLARVDTAATFGVQTRPDRASFAVWCDPVR